MPMSFLVTRATREMAMTKQAPKVEAPTIVNRTVRKYLTGREVEKLMDHSRKHSRYGHRDSTMSLVTYRHRMRASEGGDLQLHQCQRDQRSRHDRRARKEWPSVH